MLQPADNCTASPTIELSKDDVTNWSSTLSYTCSGHGGQYGVRAGDGRQRKCSRSTSVTLTIEDNTDPTISSITSGVTEILSGAGSATIDASSYVTASDNCTASGSLIYEISETDGSGYATTFVADCNDLGDKTFYFRVTDASGNVSTGSQVIAIADQTAPAISSVSGVTVNLDANGDATITASDTYVTATDNCTASGGLTYLVSRASDGTFTSTLAVDCADLGSLGPLLQGAGRRGQYQRRLFGSDLHHCRCDGANDLCERNNGDLGRERRLHIDSADPRGQRFRQLLLHP